MKTTLVLEWKNCLKNFQIKISSATGALNTENEKFHGK